MKRHFSVVVLAMATALLAFSQFGCASPQNTNTSTVTATPEPTPDKTAIEAELTKIENDWPRIIKERDGATVRRIEADDVVIVYPDGSMVNKDSAVVTLRYTVKNAKIKSPDGKSLDVSGQYLSLDTFARRNGQWQFV